MSGEYDDIPPHAWRKIKRYSHRKKYELLWKGNLHYTPEIEAIWLTLIETAINIGGIKGYKLGKQEMEDDDED